MNRLVWLEGRDGPIAINPDQVRAVQRAPKGYHPADDAPHTAVDMGGVDGEGGDDPYVVRGTPAHVVNMLRGTGERVERAENAASRWVGTTVELEVHGVAMATRALLDAYDSVLDEGGSLVIEVRR